MSSNYVQRDLGQWHVLLGLQLCAIQRFLTPSVKISDFNYHLVFWWTIKLNIYSGTFLNVVFNLYMYVDASLQGWEARLDWGVASGLWSAAENQLGPSIEKPSF